jgi:hypothetical protein
MIIKVTVVVSRNDMDIAKGTSIINPAFYSLHAVIQL